MDQSTANPLQPPDARVPGAGPWLLLDAAGPRVQTGLWMDGRWLAFDESPKEAGTALFSGTETVLRQAGTSIGDVAGFLFCRGPGSQLGIRIAAMAIHGWRALRETPPPVIGYTSHALLAARLLERGTPPPFRLLSDARRNQWTVTAVDETGAINPPETVPSESLTECEEPFFRMEERRPSPCPVQAEILQYSLECDAGLFLKSSPAQPMHGPEPLPWHAPDYRKWTPDRHR